jgi:hypothetical protein
MTLLKIAATPVSAGVNGLEVARPSPSSSRRMLGTCMPDLPGFWVICGSPHQPCVNGLRVFDLCNRITLGGLMSQPRYTFFLAHAGRDTECAKELRNLLHPDVEVFLDAYDLDPGDEWDIELPRRQRQAQATIALLSSATETAYYLREEIASAIAYQRHEPDTHRLIPVYLDGIPKDPSKIPYGMRVRHALDAALLGMAGVAAELKKVAADLTIAPSLSLPLDTPKPADRIAVFEALCKILPAMFEEIVFRLRAPKQYLAPTNEPLARRALDLVQWVEQGGPARMNDLCDAIRKVAPGVLPTVLQPLPDQVADLSVSEIIDKHLMGLNAYFRHVSSDKEAVVEPRRQDGTPEFLYPEATGYAILNLIFLFNLTANPEHLERAHRCARWICSKEVLHPRDGGVRARLFEESQLNQLDQGRFRGWCLCLFDTAICLEAISSLCQTDPDPARQKAVKEEYGEALSKMASFIEQMLEEKNPISQAGANGSQICKRTAEERWSMRFGPYLMMAAAALVGYTDVIEDLERRKVLQDKAQKTCNNLVSTQQHKGNFETTPGFTDLHAHCYAAEGLLAVGRALHLNEHVTKARMAIEWALDLWDKHGKLPQIIDANGQDFVQSRPRNDAIAQVLTLGIKLWRDNPLSEKHVAVLDRLANYLLETRRSGKQLGLLPTFHTASYYSYGHISEADADDDELKTLSSWTNFFVVESLAEYVLTRLIKRSKAIVLAGGKGRRAWPLSNWSRPKALVELLLGDRSPLQETLARLKRVIPADEIYVVTAQAAKTLASEQAVKEGIQGINVLQKGNNITWNKSLKYNVGSLDNCKCSASKGLVATADCNNLDIRRDANSLTVLNREYPELETDPDDFSVLSEREKVETKLVSHLVDVTRLATGLLKAGRFTVSPDTERYLRIACLYHDFGGTLEKSKETEEKEIRDVLKSLSALDPRMLDSRIVETLARGVKVSKDLLWRYIDDSIPSAVDFLEKRIRKAVDTPQSTRAQQWKIEKDVVTLVIATQENPELFKNLLNRFEDELAREHSKGLHKSVTSEDIKVIFGCLKTADNLVAGRWKWKRGHGTYLLTGRKTELEDLAATCAYTSTFLSLAGLDPANYIHTMLHELAAPTSEGTGLRKVEFDTPASVCLGDSMVASVVKTLQGTSELRFADQLFLYWYFPHNKVYDENVVKNYLDKRLPQDAPLSPAAIEQLLQILYLSQELPKCKTAIESDQRKVDDLRLTIRKWVTDNHQALQNIPRLESALKFFLP